MLNQIHAAATQSITRTANGGLVVAAAFALAAAFSVGGMSFTIAVAVAFVSSTGCTAGVQQTLAQASSWVLAAYTWVARNV